MQTQSSSSGPRFAGARCRTRRPLRPSFTLPVVSFAALGALACARGEPEELGYTSDTLAATEEDGAITPRSFYGNWLGVAVDSLALTDDPGLYQFPSGSTSIQLQLVDYGSGSLIFGAGTPSEPIDSNDSYPPGMQLSDYQSNPTPEEGFEYQLFTSRFVSEVAAENIVRGRGYEEGPDTSLAEADGILRLQYMTMQASARWCELHTALPDGQGGYNCVGALGVEQAEDGLCYTFNSETDFYPRAMGQFGVVPDPAREVDCVSSFQCLEQCFCPSPGGDGDLAQACMGRGDTLGELWLRRTAEGLLGVFSGDAVFENARGARTSLGRVQFRPATE
jgi:hypothetical protein